MVLHREGQELRLTVTNDGEIVPAEMRDAIFAPFFRNTRKSEAPGTGIGLALSRSLAELHHGTLTMGSSETVNEFILTVPYSSGAVSAEPESVPDEAAGTTPDTVPEPVWEACSILVVEANPAMQAFIRRQLSEHYSVITAENGVEALELLEKNYINLIVSDIMMPKMDGIELCERVKNDLRYSHIP